MTDRLDAPRLVVPRAHNAGLRAAGLAAVYWRMCPVVPGWSRAACDAKFDSPPLILWQCPTAVFADECTNAGLHGPSITPERAERVAAIAAELAAEHGARFVGVRVWALSRPRQSLLLTPNGSAELLVDTPWWPERIGCDR